MARLSRCQTPRGAQGRPDSPVTAVKGVTQLCRRTPRGAQGRPASARLLRQRLRGSRGTWRPHPAAQPRLLLAKRVLGRTASLAARAPLPSLVCIFPEIVSHLRLIPFLPK